MGSEMCIRDSAQMAKAGVRRALAYVTSTFSSYSGCRKYREDLYEAVQGLENPPLIDKLRMGFNHPGFVRAMADRVAAELEKLPQAERAATPILFTAHSLPEPMAHASRYEAQLRASCQLVGDALEHQRWRLVFQSNNASYGPESWLGPDIAVALRETRAAGAASVVVAPIGFVCEHMETVLDLDVKLAVVAREIGINMLRASTVNTHPAHVSMVRELVVERLTPNAPRLALGTLGPSHDRCEPDCCLSGRPGPTKPSLCGTDDPYVVGQAPR